MAIRIETSKRRGIDNHQDGEIIEGNKLWFRNLPSLHPNAKVRTNPSVLFNCHGLTFACRRSKILDLRNIRKVLEDDCWSEMALADILPGDIVIYFDGDGDANHSGIIVQYSPEELTPLIVSKWGYGPEFVHRLSDVPEMYGPITKFYRCHL
jgi:hypothetical protein